MNFHLCLCVVCFSGRARGADRGGTGLTEDRYLPYDYM